MSKPNKKNHARVLQQVEDLFSAIASLPSELRLEALKKIESKLPVQSEDQLEETVQESTKSNRPTVKVEVLCDVVEGGEEDAHGDDSDEFLVDPANDYCSSSSSESDRPVLPKKKKKTQIKVTKKKRKATRKRKRSKQTESEEEYDEEEEDKEKELQEDEDDEKIMVFKVPSGMKPGEISQPLKEIEEHPNGKKVKGTRTVYGCPTCEKKFMSRNQVKIHMRTHTGEKPFLCDVCNKRFSQDGALKMHMKRHKGIQDHSCEFCDYKSTLKVDMLRHIERRHTSDRNYSCDVCAKRFSTDVGLKYHIRHVHERAEKYVCQECGLVTHRVDNLKRHMIVCHSDKELIQCPVCSDVLKQRSSFIAHMRRHTGERPHKCSKCTKSFKSHSQVAAHMRSHVDGTFACPECKRLFKTRFHLKRHSVIHTGEKPYACMHCNYACNVKGNITKHVRSVHGIEDFSFVGTGTEKARDDLCVSPTMEKAKEKGKETAVEFLTRISLRKDEQLTVKDLQMEAKSQKKDNAKKVRKAKVIPKTPKKQPSKRMQTRSCKEDVDLVDSDMMSNINNEKVIVEGALLDEGTSIVLSEDNFFFATADGGNDAGSMIYVTVNDS